VITDHHFRALAAGDGDADTVALLLAGLYSKRLLLVQAVRERTRLVADPDAIASLDAAHALLSRVEGVAPAVVREAMTHPRVGIWAAQCLTSASAGYLACVAASAALATGTRFDLEVPVQDGMVSLPALGTASAPAADGTARLRSSGRGATLTAPGLLVTVPADHRAPAPGWCPARMLRAPQLPVGPELAVELDDHGPYRTSSGLRAGPPLTGTQAARWSGTLTRAWRLLTTRHPGSAGALAAGIRTLVPLPAREDDQSNSATVLNAFGAVLLTQPHDAASLALTLLHEFQHAKLAALHDLLPLHTAAGATRFYAPWRQDPRPVGALLHGAYAHLGVAGFWRASPAPIAAAEFAYWCAATRVALVQLAGSGELTDAGQRFVAGMGATLDGWQAAPLPDHIRQAAAERLAANLTAWRTRHCGLDRELGSGAVMR